MKRIIKNNSPIKFEEWKNSQKRTFKSFKRNGNIKHLVKNSLLEEQGFICCYCGKRVENNEFSTLEHLKCKDRNKNLELDYNNILISCNGGRIDRHENIDFFPLSCDAHKGSDDIEITPLDSRCENEFVYDDEGGIISKSKKASETIKTLNLDNEILRNLRKAALEPFIESIDNVEENKILIKHYSEKRDGKYEPYLNAILSYLKFNI